MLCAISPIEAFQATQVERNLRLLWLLADPDQALKQSPADIREPSAIPATGLETIENDGHGLITLGL